MDEIFLVKRVTQFLVLPIRYSIIRYNNNIKNKSKVYSL